MTVIGKYVPPFTVASLATITHVVPLDPADAGDDAGAGRLVVVHAVRRERAAARERRSRVEQPVDALADGQLAALAVAGDRALVATGAPLADRRGLRAQLVDKRLHARAVRTCLFAVCFNPRRQHRHRGR